MPHNYDILFWGLVDNKRLHQICTPSLGVPPDHPGPESSYWPAQLRVGVHHQGLLVTSSRQEGEPPAYRHQRHLHLQQRKAHPNAVSWSLGKEIR